MPLSEQDYADQDDNILFRALKIKDFDQVRNLLLPHEISQELSSSSSSPTTATNNKNKNLIHELDIYNNTILHTALGYKAPNDVIERIIKLYPTATTIKGSNDWLPLHVAAMYGCDREILIELIKCYPEALDDYGEGKGIKGRTPRHYRHRHPATKDIFEKTTKEWKEIIQQQEEKKDDDDVNADDEKEEKKQQEQSMNEC